MRILIGDCHEDIQLGNYLLFVDWPTLLADDAKSDPDLLLNFEPPILPISASLDADDGDGQTSTTDVVSATDVVSDAAAPKRLLGFICPSDDAFDTFVSPISNPLFFEDPRTLSEIKPIFIEHAIPRSTPVLRGADIQVYAVQMRFALSERLSLIATKDGWIDLHSPGVGDRQGWADVAAGLKYNFLRDPENQRLLSGGFTFEIDMGEHDVFQGQGDGEFHFFVSGATKLNDCLHWMSGSDGPSTK